MSCSFWKPQHKFKKLDLTANSFLNTKSKHCKLNNGVKEKCIKKSR